MNLKYAYTILYVEDVEQTILFYNKAFGFERKLLTPQKDYGEIESGATRIAFANFELGRSNFKNGFVASSLKQQPFGMELAFTTDNVSTVMEKAIENGAELLSEATEKPWGQIVGYIRDLNGFIIEVCTPIKG